MRDTSGQRVAGARGLDDARGDARRARARAREDDGACASCVCAQAMRARAGMRAIGEGDGGDGAREREVLGRRQSDRARRIAGSLDDDETRGLGRVR